MKPISCLAFFTLIFAILTAGQTRADLIALKAERLFDARQGEIIEPALILVRNGLIEAINPTELPEDVTVMDFGDSTLLPGLIDTHTHLTMDYFTDDFWVTAYVNETAADWSVRGAKFARVTLDAGFTSVRDVGAWPGFPDVALMRAIERGDVQGPEIWPAGHAISMTGGHCDVTGFAPGILEFGPKQGIADGVDEVIKAVRYQAKHGVRVIKVCATGGVLSFSQNAEVGALQYSLEELQAIVREATKLGLKVAAHAHGTEGINTAIRAGVASIEHGSILSDESIQLMKENGTYLVPQAYINEMSMPPETPASVVAKNEYLKPLVISSIQKAYEAGVNMALGTDSAVYKHGENGREFAVMVDYGIDPAYALQMATLFAADLVGVDDRGVLETGKRADIIAVEGNPLDDISTMEAVSFVMRGGKVYKQ